MWNAFSIHSDLNSEGVGCDFWRFAGGVFVQPLMRKIMYSVLGFGTSSLSKIIKSRGRQKNAIPFKPAFFLRKMYVFRGSLLLRRDTCAIYRRSYATCFSPRETTNKSCEKTSEFVKKSCATLRKPSALVFYELFH